MQFPQCKATYQCSAGEALAKTDIWGLWNRVLLSYVIVLFLRANIGNRLNARIPSKGMQLCAVAKQGDWLFRLGRTMTWLALLHGKDKSIEVDDYETDSLIRKASFCRASKLIRTFKAQSRRPTSSISGRPCLVHLLLHLAMAQWTSCMSLVVNYWEWPEVARWLRPYRELAASVSV
jgi:hypothetical protein